MMAQEIRLKASNVTRTNLATGPVLESRSRVSPPTKIAGYENRCMWFREYLDRIIDDSPELSYRTYPKHNVGAVDFSFRLAWSWISLIYATAKDVIKEGQEFTEFSGRNLMANYGMLRNYRFTDTTEDIRGAKLYGLNDEKLGKIDDVIFDHSEGTIRYVVVDTGGWLSTKKFIVPAERLRASTKHDDDFTVDLTKAQVESFPPYTETDLESDEQWSDYEGKYRSKWDADPVMHREGTDRNITPTTQQMLGNSPSARAAGAPNAARTAPGDTPEIEDTAFMEPGYAAGTDTVEIDTSAVGIGPRWDTFQNRLRERRKEVVGLGQRREDEYPKAS
jgi:sporulation protein YlmC with PRC-barrel domain